MSDNAAAEQWVKALAEFAAAGDAEGWRVCRQAWSMPLDLRTATIKGLDLRGFNFSRGNLAECVFQDCNLSGADLSSCNVDFAKFLNCDLTGCYVGATNFRWSTVSPPDSLAAAVDAVPPPAPRPAGGGIAATACQSKAVGVTFGRG